MHPPAAAVRDAVALALAEDLLPLGDLTASLLPEGAMARGALVARGSGVLAGRRCAMEAFAQIDRAIEIEWTLDDGDDVAPGQVLAHVSGPLASVLTAERTALNFLGHLSGVASLTQRYVDAVAQANPATRVWDTRKTTPGLRALEKAAVRAGGGVNHRGSLSEGVLVKDNHLTGMAIGDAVASARQLWPGRLLEVECDRIEQVTEAVAAGAGLVLLDNMDPDQVQACVALVRQQGNARTLVEVSGRVSLESVGDYARAGADLISVGAITHSAPVLDIGLDVET
ncbi:MAG: carboxylating nicotinate-nucleotide diphosphorylase [Acidimicrobiales bacterium]|nr:MAG: carboxylating nicotinate-nucleotide diphosphorylase [Acidimicrobiales bacterium]